MAHVFPFWLDMLYGLVEWSIPAEFWSFGFWAWHSLGPYSSFML